MDCALIDFLIHGRLGSLSIGLGRTKVVELLGPPTEWDPRSPTIPVDKCNLWLYNQLQINFSKDNRIKDLMLLCRVYKSDTTLFPVSFSPLVFVDLEPTTVGEFHDFVAFLKEKNLPFSEETDLCGGRVIRTAPGVAARFSKKYFVEKSYQEGRPIQSESYYLDKITASEAYQIPAVDI